jgi:hypothetical protein
MELTGISCANYKAFRERATLEIRPLTILLGKNNAGKSALVRLVLQLMQGFSSKAEDHLDLRVGHIEYGRVFRDLIHRHVPHGSISVGVRFADGAAQLEIEATIQNILPRLAEEYTVISQWEARGAVDLHFDWEQTPTMPPVYHGAYQPRFRGLWPRFPEGTPPDSLQALAQWQSRADDLERQLSYLGPIRPPIARVCPVQRSTRLDWLGENAPQMLATDDALLAAVARWYHEHLEGWEVSIDQAGSAFEVLLRRGQTSVNMADAGYGMSQVLPVVTQQCALALQGAAAPGLYIVEQPELHLHHGAHGDLADLFAANAGHPGVRMLVETHSENFLLRLRRRIADGSLDRARVALYWIDELPEGASCVRPLEILPSGEIPDWPEGVFSEGYRDVVAMRRATRAAVASSNQ